MLHELDVSVLGVVGSASRAIHSFVAVQLGLAYRKRTLTALYVLYPIIYLSSFLDVVANSRNRRFVF